MHRSLSPTSRALWALLTVTFGLAPSVGFFVWVERNLALPYLPIRWSWPWVLLETEALEWILAFDAALILGFGLLHSLFARDRIQTRIFGGFPQTVWRPLYLIQSGLALLLLMGCWQHTGRIIWAIQTSPGISIAISASFFWGLLLIGARGSRGIDFAEFIGLRSLGILPERAGKTSLVTGGAYAFVRHPLYLFLFAAFLITPVMTLDRLFLTGVLAVYVTFAIPFEEKKLVAHFGSEYLQYRKRVPAVLPFTQTRRDPS